MKAAPDHLQHLAALGREFVRRGMADHARALRLYYLAARSALVGPSGSVELRWSSELTIEWLKTLRVPPFDGAYEVKLPGVPCFRCRAPKGQHRSAAAAEATFPGGARMRCQSCQSVWVVDGFRG